MMPKIIDLRRRLLPMSEWPAADQAAWNAMQRSIKGRFSARGPAADLAPATIEKARRGYARWLNFLLYHGLLVHDAGVLDRLNETWIALYFDELQALGNRDYTIVGRFLELETAVRIMVPDADVSWLNRPGGVPLRQRLAMERQVLQIHSSRALFAWGFELMEQAVTLTTPVRRAVLLRDGLLICLLSAVGVRLRSVQLMRLGRHLRFDGTEWWITLGPTDLKIPQFQDMPLPTSLTPWLQRYVEVERQTLLAGHTSDAVWIGTGGKPLTDDGLDSRIRLRSRARFGRANGFGVHRFRYSIGTTLPLMFPDTPGLSTGVLKISGAVHAKHYDRGLRAAAAQDYLTSLDDDRKEARAFLRRANAKRKLKPPSVLIP